jgi:hypothetical protein
LQNDDRERVTLQAFVAGDVYIDYPYEDAKFRYEKATGKVYRRFYGETEFEIDPTSELYHEGISGGWKIDAEDYDRDHEAASQAMTLAKQSSEERIAAARALAGEIHHGQRDKGGRPYIYHVLDVARRVADRGADFEIVALLHDAVEDAPAHRPLSFAEIEQHYGAAVSAGVDAMTKRSSPSKEDYLEDYLPRLAADPIGKVVKIADASHNISKAHLIADESEQKRLRTKYATALSYLGADPAEAERPIVFVETESFTGWRELAANDG